MNIRKAFRTARQYVRANRHWLANFEWCDQLELGPNGAEPPEAIAEAIRAIHAWAQARADKGWRPDRFTIWAAGDFAVRRADRPEWPFYGPVPEPLSLHWRITARRA